MISVHIVSGLDIGNGYVKGKATVDGSEPYIVDAPSVVCRVPQSRIKTQLSDAVMDHFENSMEATILSPCIDRLDAGNVVFGKSAITSGAMPMEFDIDDRKAKCETSLSGFLVLGSIATVALEDQYKKTGTLPEEMEVNTVCALAIPIDDYKDYHDIYSNRLTGAVHTVNVMNFDKRVVVNIKFDRVVVLPEGAAAQYAIPRLGAKFLDAALADARSRGVPISEEVTGEMLVAATNTIGVDVGEGTTNFPVYTDGKVNMQVSASINYGWGAVLEDVVNETRNQGLFDSRKSLGDFLEEPAQTPSRRRIVSIVQPLIDERASVLASEIGSEYSRIFRSVGARTDAVYVYGGGATKLQPYLLPILSEMSTFGGEAVPIIYLDSSYSRNLNRNGLFAAAEAVMKK